MIGEKDPRQELEENPQVTFSQDANGDECCTVKLRHPFEYNEREVVELKFRIGTAKDWEATDRAKGEVGKSMILAARLSGYPSEALRNLKGRDGINCFAAAGYMGNA